MTDTQENAMSTEPEYQCTSCGAFLHGTEVETRPHVCPEPRPESHAGETQAPGGLPIDPEVLEIGNYPPRCSQCGQKWDAPACGPTHAFVAAQRAAESQPAAALCLCGWMVPHREGGPGCRKYPNVQYRAEPQPADGDICECEPWRTVLRWAEATCGAETPYLNAARAELRALAARVEPYSYPDWLASLGLGSLAATQPGLSLETGADEPWPLPVVQWRELP
jgi:hypothetical protein